MISETTGGYIVSQSDCDGDVVGLGEGELNARSNKPEHQIAQSRDFLIPQPPALYRRPPFNEKERAGERSPLLPLIKGII